MDRRTFLHQAGMIIAAGSVAIAAPAPAGASERAAGASERATHPLVSWDLVGGFLGPGFAALRPARLAVYPDGRAIADAERQVRLRPAELTSLSQYARSVLRNGANGHRRPGAPIVADAPATLFQAGRFRIQAEALQESRSFHAYPKPLYLLLDRLDAVHGRAVDHYRGDGVRLVAVPADGTTGAVAWPAGVPVPTIGAGQVNGIADLSGAHARTVVRDMPRRNAWDWQVYRTANGRVLRATWRYLLPHELSR